MATPLAISAVLRLAAIRKEFYALRYFKIKLLHKTPQLHGIDVKEFLAAKDRHSKDRLRSRIEFVKIKFTRN